MERRRIVCTYLLRWGVARLVHAHQVLRQDDPPLELVRASVAGSQGGAGSGSAEGRGAYFADLTPLFEDFGYYADPRRYGLAPLGAYGSCLTGAYGETPAVTLCADPDAMVFWDEYQ